MQTTRHLLAVVAVVAALACSPSSALTQSLWSAVEYGMTPADVSHALRGSKLVGNRDTHTRRAAVKLDGFVYAGKTFNVDFIFESDRLVQVHLRDAVFMELKSAEFLPDFHGLGSALMSARAPAHP